VEERKEGEEIKEKREGIQQRISCERADFEYRIAEGAARRRRGSPQASLFKTWAERKPSSLVGFLGYCLHMHMRHAPLHITPS